MLEWCKIWRYLLRRWRFRLRVSSIIKHRSHTKIPALSVMSALRFARRCGLISSYSTNSRPRMATEGKSASGRYADFYDWSLWQWSCGWKCRSSPCVSGRSTLVKHLVKYSSFDRTLYLLWVDQAAAVALVGTAEPPTQPLAEGGWLFHWHRPCGNFHPPHHLPYWPHTNCLYRPHHLPHWPHTDHITVPTDHIPTASTDIFYQPHNFVKQCYRLWISVDCQSLPGFYFRLFIAPAVLKLSLPAKQKKSYIIQCRVWQANYRMPVFFL